MSRGFEVLDFPARWDDLDDPDADIAINKWGKQYNRNAGFTRNQQMLDEGKPDLVIAFPGGNGTAHMIKRSLLAGVEVIKIKF